jgi:hypothetical protein
MATATRVDLPFSPRSYQRDAHALRMAFRFLVLVWHRRAGKTVFAVMELVLAALACTLPRGRYGYVGPLLNQTKDNGWAYLKAFTDNIPGRVVNESELSITLPNGARIRIHGADNPDSIKGAYFDGVVMDEVAQMKPQVWGEVVRPMLTDRRGWALFIGTPKGVNLFSKLYYAAIGGKKGWKGDMRRVSDTGCIPPEELAEARADMSPQEYAQEFECDFAAAVTNTLVPLNAVLEAQKRAIPESAYLFAPKILGIDVAREGDDRSCFFPRQGLATFKPRVMRIDDLMVLAGQAAEYVDKWRPDAVFVDAGGMGAGVIDRLRQLGYPCIGVDFGGTALDARFENRRTEMWWNMAEWIKTGGGCLSNMEDLTEDLVAPTYEYANDRGRVALESKKKMKKRGLASPDIADALALTFAAPVAIQTELDRLRAEDRRRRGRDYDPFDETRR